MSNELKRCPFCSGQAYLSNDHRTVGCHHCEAEMHNDPEGVYSCVTLWNARPDPINPTALSDLIAMDPAGEIDGGMGDDRPIPITPSDVRRVATFCRKVIELGIVSEDAAPTIRANQTFEMAAKLADLGAERIAQLERYLAAEREKVAELVEALEPFSIFASHAVNPSAPMDSDVAPAIFAKSVWMKLASALAKHKEGE